MRCKAAPFLGAPGLYPEHAPLIEASPHLHAAVRAFHEHRLQLLGSLLLLYTLLKPNPEALHLRALAAHFAGLKIAITCAGLSSVSFAALQPALKALETPISAAVGCSAVAWCAVLSSSGSWGAGAGLWVSLVMAAQTMKALSFAVAASELRSVPLTFSQYLEFLLLAPTLRCEVDAFRICGAPPPRQRRPLRALEEGFAALVTAVTVHVLLHAFVAPAMRLLATSFASAQWWEALAGALAVVLLGPLVRFLCFYLHWHCVCNLFAELTGYPDRDFYGPWWLVVDDPAHFFRLWSKPVHDWLRHVVYTPLTRPQRPQTFTTNGKRPTSTLQTADISTLGRAHGSGPNVDSAKNGTGPVPVAGGRNGGRGGKKARRNWAMLAAFVVSSFLHELVVTATLGLFVPICTFNLVFAAVTIMVWNKVFPPRRESKNGGGESKIGESRREKGTTVAAAAVLVGVDGGTTAECINGKTNIRPSAAGTRGPVASWLFGILTLLGEAWFSIVLWLAWRSVYVP